LVQLVKVGEGIECTEVEVPARIGKYLDCMEYTFRLAFLGKAWKLTTIPYLD
jgi:hypothetical protein